MAPNGPMLDMLRATLTRARSLAAKEVRFLSEGVEIVDALGTTRQLTVGGEPVPVDVTALREFVETHGHHGGRSRGGSRAESQIDGHGVWLLGAEQDDLLSMKPKKPFPSTLEQVTKATPELLATIRCSYGLAGVDVFLEVEGESRLRELGAAITAERTLAGLGTAGSLPPVLPAYAYSSEPYEGYEGPDVFDPIAPTSGTDWELAVVDHDRAVREFLDPRPGDVSRIWLSEKRRYGGGFVRATKQLNERERPAVAAELCLEKSVPVLRTATSRSMSAAVAAAAPLASAPWVQIEDRRAARTAGRQPKEKTWFPTSEAVADAFLVRRAPRGYVSGRSLYFHGPVAFAAYDRNPVAALVDLPGGETILFFGRDPNIGGTLAGTVTSAQYDVMRAARERFRAFHVGSLTDFLTWGGKSLDAVAQGMRHDKDEYRLPASCAVDVPRLALWLTERQEAALGELQAAQQTTFPTMRKANAFRSLERLSDMRDVLAMVLGAKLPAMSDQADMKRRADEEAKSANERSIEIVNRKRAAEEARRAETQAPRFG